MLLPTRRRVPALGGAFLLILATGLAACSSKNPLIDDETPGPTTSSRQTAPAALPSVTPPKATAPTVTKPATPPAAPQARPATAPAPTAPTSTAPAAPATQSGASLPATADKPAPTTTSATILANQGKPAPTGMQRVASMFSPYRIDIQQGNFISHEMLAQLRKGMTKEQVRFLLGSPLLNDMFHDWRWDYLFRLQKPNGQLTANRVTIYFKDNRVERFENSQLPTEVDYISNIVNPDAKPKAAPAKPTAKPEAKPKEKPDERPYD